MKLLINGLSARLGGGQTYLYQLLRHLPSEWHVTLLSSGRLDAAQLPARIQHIEMPALKNPFRRTWWEQTKLEAFAKHQGCEIILNPACLLPRIASPQLKTAVVFQNMLPFDTVQRRAYPLFSYRRLRDMLLACGLISAIKRADLVIFISQHARHYITQQRNIAPKQSVVIPLGVDPIFFAPSAPPDLPALGGAPYFLYVSFLDFYKCQREVVQAFATLKAQQPIPEKLVFVGGGYERYVTLLKQDITALGLQNDVVLLGNVPHETLPSLYQHATLNVFASTCENCPNILLEMMASGTAALVSDHGPMPEIAGDTVTYFDPRNHQEFVKAWADMLHSVEPAKAKAAQAAERAKTYRWESAIAQTIQALTALLRTP